MLGLYYFNWAGTPEEFKEYIGRMKNICDGIEGVEFKGLFTPTSEWHFVFLVEFTIYEKGLEVLKTYRKKYGSAKVALAKAEILHTPEEFGITL